MISAATLFTRRSDQVPCFIASCRQACTRISDTTSCPRRLEILIMPLSSPRTQQLNSISWVTSGFLRRVNYTFVLLGCYTAQIGSYLATFRETYRFHLQGLISPVRCLGCLIQNNEDFILSFTFRPRVDQCNVACSPTSSLNDKYVRFEILIKVRIIISSWRVTARTLADEHKHLEGTRRLHIQGKV